MSRNNNLMNANMFGHFFLAFSHIRGVATSGISICAWVLRSRSRVSISISYSGPSDSLVIRREISFLSHSPQRVLWIMLSFQSEIYRIVVSNSEDSEFDWQIVFTFVFNGGNAYVDGTVALISTIRLNELALFRLIVSFVWAFSGRINKVVSHRSK